jgi:hypothetical protein
MSTARNTTLAPEDWRHARGKIAAQIASGQVSRDAGIARLRQLRRRVGVESLRGEDR